MGKYSSNVRKAQKPNNRETHVLWRGIGCLIMLIIPAISIAAGILTINYGLDNNWPIPYQLLGYPKLPDIFYKSTGLMTIFSPILSINHFNAYAVTSVLYMILIGGGLSVFYAFLYRMVGPSRYGPTDAPPPNVKVKRYTR